MRTYKIAVHTRLKVDLKIDAENGLIALDKARQIIYEQDFGDNAFVSEAYPVVLDWEETT